MTDGCTDRVNARMACDDGPMSAEDRARARDFIDLQEGRGPVPVLDLDGVDEILRQLAGSPIIGASDDPGRPSFSVLRYLVHHGFDCVPVNPNVSDVLGIAAFRDVGGGGRGHRPIRYRRCLPTPRVLRRARSGGRGRRGTMPVAPAWGHRLASGSDRR